MRLVLSALPKRLRAAALAGAVLATGPFLAGTAHAAAPMSSQLGPLSTAGYRTLESYMIKSSPSDPRYYARGAWYATDGPACWYCYDSAAVAAATFSQQPGADPTLAAVAVATFKTAIAGHQLPGGAFANGDGVADGISTGFFSVDLGMAYLELHRTLSPETRASWSTAIARASDYLIGSGNMTWYVNGNVNLRQTEVMWLAWSITHQQRFLTAYDSEYAFTIAPSQGRWRGFGLQLTHAPARRDGRDGAGYLAESGGAAPGFDSTYTDAQLDTATDLFVLTKDPRYLRLMNLLFNQLRPRIDARWTLDATGGSRKDYMTPFMNPALSVLASSGDRPDLVSGVAVQVARTSSEYINAQTYTNVNFYKGFESWISMPFIARQWPGGLAPDLRVAPASALQRPGNQLRLTVTPMGRGRRTTFKVALTGLSSRANVHVRLTERRGVRGRQNGSFTSPTLASGTRLGVRRGSVVLTLHASTRQLLALRQFHWLLTVRVTIVTNGRSHTLTAPAFRI